MRKTIVGAGYLLSFAEERLVAGRMLFSTNFFPTQRLSFISLKAEGSGKAL